MFMLGLIERKITGFRRGNNEFTQLLKRFRSMGVLLHQRPPSIGGCDSPEGRACVSISRRYPMALAM